MAASDHLGGQFSTWFHGTTADAAESIRANGLTSSEYGAWEGGDEPVAKNPTLAGSQERAARIAQLRNPGQPVSVVELRVPAHQVGEHLTVESPLNAGLNKPLPPSMIHAVHSI